MRFCKKSWTFFVSDKEINRPKELNDNNTIITYSFLLEECHEELENKGDGVGNCGGLVGSQNKGGF
jgi:hypothetical protein